MICDRNVCTIFCSPAFQRRVGDVHHSLLVIQCDSGHLNGDLIACARYRIYDKRAEAALRNEREGCTHVLFIIHLPRLVAGSSFVGFQGDPWISTHIDDLRPTTDGTIALHKVMGLSISQLFYGSMAPDKGEKVGEKISTVEEKVSTTIQEDFEQDEEMSIDEERSSQSPPPPELPPIETSAEPPKAPEGEEPLNFTSDAAEMPAGQILPPVPTGNGMQGDSGPYTSVEGNCNAQFRRLHSCIQAAASRLQDSTKNKERATKRVAILDSLIQKKPSFALGMYVCFTYLHIPSLLIKSGM